MVSNCFRLPVPLARGEGTRETVSYHKPRSSMITEIILALLPILVIFFLLFVCGRSAIVTGVVAYSTAGVIAYFSDQFAITETSIFTASLKGLLICFTATYVVFFGILLFQLMNELRVIQAIGLSVVGLTRNPIYQVLLLVIAFSPLVESVGGFGTAVIIVCPILQALGFSSFKSALLSLVSLTAVPWGAMATGTVIGANLGEIPLKDIGLGCALLSVPTFIYFTFVAVYVAAGWQGIQKCWAESLIVSLSMAGCVWLFSKSISTELVGILASLATACITVVVIRCFEKSIASDDLTSRQSFLVNQYGLLKALSPYLFLTLILLVSRTNMTMQEFLTSYGALVLPQYSYKMPLLYSPGFYLAITCFYTVMVFRLNIAAIRKSLIITFKQSAIFVLSTAPYLCMSEVMLKSGMTDALALAVAGGWGGWYAVLCPLVGSLGGFLTGSNTGSNAMFMKVQVSLAHQLGIPIDLTAAVQNTGGAHITMASPSRVALATSVCEIPQEKLLFRKIASIALGGIVLLIIMFFVLLTTSIDIQ